MSGTDGFTSGRRLARMLYDDVVAPALATELPRLAYAAGLIGPGSDVLGYDTVRSTDHDWGPRLQLIVDDHDDAEHDRLAASILAVVQRQLPDRIGGVPVELPGADRLPGDEGTPRRHGVTVTSVARLRRDLLGTDDPPEHWDAERWLTVPRQSLLELTTGPLFRDDTGRLTADRRVLAWYPHDVWLYAMSGRWQRIAQLEPFVGRAAEAGDDLGSRVVAGQLGRDAVQLALLQHRRYAPYAKWLGTGFARHEPEPTLHDHLEAVLAAADPVERCHRLAQAMLLLARRHDALGVTAPIGAEIETFFTRPYPVIWAERFGRALHAAITDPAVAALPYGLGGIDELTDSTDALKSLPLRAAVAEAYRGRAAAIGSPEPVGLRQTGPGEGRHGSRGAEPHVP